MNGNYAPLIQMGLQMLMQMSQPKPAMMPQYQASVPYQRPNIEQVLCSRAPDPGSAEEAIIQRYALCNPDY